MGSSPQKKIQGILRNDRGAALLQVVFVSGLLGIVAFLFVKFMITGDWRALRSLRRNQHVNTALEMSDFVSDRDTVRSTATAVSEIGKGPAIKYE